MVEIKPKKYLSKPKYNQRKTKRYYTESYNYIKNNAKWKAAREYCEDNNIECSGLDDMIYYLSIALKKE